MTDAFDAFAQSMAQDNGKALEEQAQTVQAHKDVKLERLDKLVFSPQQIGSQSIALLTERKDARQPGVETGIGTLDNWFLPMRPGEMIGVLGFTSNGKSSLMSWIARQHAAKIRKRQDGSKGIVLSVTWEQSVEEQGVVDIAQIAGINVSSLMRGDGSIDWNEVTRASVRRSQIPWWWIGHSVLDNSKRPRMDMETLREVIDRLVDREGLVIELLVLDYLQRIPGRKAIRERRERFVDIVDDVKDLALSVGAPVMLGSQAGRQVKDRAWQMPLIDDAQETSNFEQSCDKMLACFYPKTSNPVGTTISDGGSEYQVTDNLFIVGLLKQKFGPANINVPLHLDPARNIITPMERVNLNDY